MSDQLIREYPLPLDLGAERCRRTIVEEYGQSGRARGWTRDAEGRAVRRALIDVPAPAPLPPPTPALPVNRRVGAAITDTEYAMVEGGEIGGVTTVANVLLRNGWDGTLPPAPPTTLATGEQEPWPAGESLAEVRAGLRMFVVVSAVSLAFWFGLLTLALRVS